MGQLVRVMWSMIFHSTNVFAKEGSEGKTVPSLTLVLQVHVLTEPAVSIGIIITTVPAHLATKERTATMILTSATNLVFVSMVASA